ncbi:MAG: DNA polymerase III subunit beta [Parcubacteria group bacterium Gr01-1014_13]|nr:MAG: DNA polymerase III subunit beta [Parcubacteria group bacterium Gr01-1014_13]
MKFFCTRENLSKALALVIGIAGKSINLPILSNVLIRASEQKVEFIATNLELAIVSNLRAKIEEPGMFTVPARTLNDFVNLLSDEKVELRLKDNELEVVSGKSATKIKGTPADEFPVVPVVGEGKGYLIDAEAFKRGLGQVSQAAAKTEIRPELAGVLFCFNDEPNTLTMAATDSYRLAEKKIKLLQGEEKARIIIPARTAQEINHILSLSKGMENEKNVRLLVTDSQVVLRCNEVELVSRLVEGQYPDYTQIIPKEFKTVAEFSTNQITKEIKAASLFTTTGVNAVNFDFDTAAGAILISSTSTQTGEHKSEVTSDIKGDKNNILLNHRYVLDGLANIDTENSLLKVINADSPCVFAPKEDKNFVYIVMPIRQ